MLKIGITGGIGSGKTTVCRIFESLGIPVFYADTVAKQIMVTDMLLVAGVKAAFGDESYTIEGKLNNKYIAQIVFNDQQELDKLNALVHPATFRAFERWMNTVPAGTPYILKEAALLFESGSYRLCDKSVLVTAPVDIRIARVMERDEVSREQVASRINKQLSDEIKKGMADYFIENKETAALIPQVLKLHHQFLK
ncbi:dephospho-CoA kinase [Pedobacter sp. MR2016-24]|uniref:dephospho-CoA kinase n=1 Tax=Pedobacter sp. MR2016-24 TaxID=2994466 RepID=UPI0022471C76|nr:dephospho-CoA kinase [Pedobacter sp. MR2016-24]MCX2482956.1 dephospho-CoA kinase [Pedobacter sp. MR2016-24]